MRARAARRRELVADRAQAAFELPHVRFAWRRLRATLRGAREASGTRLSAWTSFGEALDVIDGLRQELAQVTQAATAASENYAAASKDHQRARREIRPLRASRDGLRISLDLANELAEIHEAQCTELAAYVDAMTVHLIPPGTPVERVRQMVESFGQVGDSIDPLRRPRVRAPSS